MLAGVKERVKVFAEAVQFLSVAGGLSGYQIAPFRNQEAAEAVSNNIVQMAGFVRMKIDQSSQNPPPFSKCHLQGIKQSKRTIKSTLGLCQNRRTPKMGGFVLVSLETKQIQGSLKSRRSTMLTSTQADPRDIRGSL